MKILIACEESQIVCKAFRAKGYEAYSCDILPPSGGHPEWHIQDDVLEHLDEGWDMMIAHPPCDHLSKAGAAHWKKPHKIVLQQEALDFVNKLLNAPIKRIALENPIGKINTAVRKPDQIINPFQFGEPWTKQTCLWLKNLPKLIPTDIIEPQGNWVRPGNIRNRKWNRQQEGARGDKRLRSKTFQGIANAMAEQWSNP